MPVTLMILSQHSYDPVLIQVNFSILAIMWENETPIFSLEIDQTMFVGISTHSSRYMAWKSGKFYRKSAYDLSQCINFTHLLYFKTKSALHVNFCLCNQLKLGVTALSFLFLLLKNNFLYLRKENNNILYRKTLKILSIKNATSHFH